MSFLDTAISLGAGYLAENRPEAKESWLSRVPLLGSLAEKLNPGQKEKAEKIRGDAEKERSGIFGEVWESILVRYFPGISKLMDVASSVGITDKDPETVPWQNEFEASQLSPCLCQISCCATSLILLRNPKHSSRF